MSAAVIVAIAGGIAVIVAEDAHTVVEDVIAVAHAVHAVTVVIVVHVGIKKVYPERVPLKAG
jgi:hypothetical protein